MSNAIVCAASPTAAQWPGGHRPPPPARRFGLSPVLQQRIRRHERNAHCTCFCVQLLCGLCLPVGFLQHGAWDMDRDMSALHTEAAAVLCSLLPPASYRLEERVDHEAHFRDGKRLFLLFLEQQR